MTRCLTQIHFLTLAALLAMAGIAESAKAAWQTPAMPIQELAQSQPTATAGITTSARTAYYNITAEDVKKAVAEQLQLQGIVPMADVSLTAGSTNNLFSADHPLKVVMHALQVDTNARRWQAQANIIADGKTISVKPVSGIYTALIEVPVLNKQLGRTDVVEPSDIATKTIPERLMRKDTVTDAKQLIGQSPRAIISANRPIRMSEISAPLVIKKGDAVQLTYTNPYISLKATGVALQDGAYGDMIRVKNDKSEKAVSGRIASAGRVEVNHEMTP